MIQLNIQLGPILACPVHFNIAEAEHVLLEILQKAALKAVYVILLPQVLQVQASQVDFLGVVEALGAPEELLQEGLRVDLLPMQVVELPFLLLMKYVNLLGYLVPFGV